MICFSAVLALYLLQGLNFSFGLNSKDARVNIGLDTSEFLELKATMEALAEQLLGGSDSPRDSGERLSSLLALLEDADALEAKTMEVKHVLSTFRNNSEAVDTFLERQFQKMDGLVRVAVGHGLNLTTQATFWRELSPRLAEAGLTGNIDPELMLQVEEKKAKVREELRIRNKVEEGVESVRQEGRRKIMQGIFDNVNRHLPYWSSMVLLLVAGSLSLLLVYRQVDRAMKVPPLLDETSVRVWRCGCRRRHGADFKATVESFDTTLFKSASPEIILEPSVREAVAELALVACWTSQERRGWRRKAGPNQLPLALPNAVFYGPPGTGKSLTARRLATACGMDYAIMSGGSVLGLREEAVPELRRIFDWARWLPNGLVLFVDEADAFLSSRGGNSSHFVQAAVSFFLAQTTSSSTRLMVILATNRVDDLDEAVLSRMSKQLHFRNPSAELVLPMLRDRKQSLSPEAAKRFEDVVEAWPNLLETSLSGRDVQSLFEDFQRRWLLERASEGRKKLDLDWLRRWLQQSAVSPTHRKGSKRE